MLRRLVLLTLLSCLASTTGLPSAAAARERSQPTNDPDSWWRSLFEDPAAFAVHRNRVIEDWQKHGSYYALLEIVEGRIEPGLGELDAKQVIELLGTRHIDPDYPNARRDNFLVWSSNRLVPEGAHLVVRFDADGIARSADWVSE
jgi:hypothetical protein